MVHKLTTMLFSSVESLNSFVRWIILYDNEYASIINIYFYESFLWNFKL